MTVTQIKILRVIAGLRCVTPAELRSVFKDAALRSYHRSMGGLIEAGLVKRIFHRAERFCAYQLTPEGYTIFFGSNDIRIPVSRLNDLFHSALVSETLINLARYQFVGGITPEHEISKEKLKTFCVRRRPDAIILLKNSFGTYELALEAERSVKNKERINEILDCYEMTFQRKMECRALVVVAGNPQVFNSYKYLIEQRSSEFEEKTFLVGIQDILGLNPNVYGELLPNVALERHFGGTECHARLMLGHGNSKGYGSTDPAKAPQI